MKKKSNNIIRGIELILIGGCWLYLLTLNTSLHIVIPYSITAIIGAMNI